MNWILKKRIYYLVFGLLFFLFWFLFKLGGFAQVTKALLSTLIDVTVSIAVMLITVEISLPKFIYSKKYKLFFFAFAGTFFLGGSIIILSQLRLLDMTLLGTYQQQLAKHQKHYFYWFWADLIFGSYIMIFLVTSIGAAVRLAFDRVKESNKGDKLEKEKALTELELLKEQINPHFLFNALNTIYYKIDRNNTEGRETLQRFSNMLRYQLYDCNKPFVEVENELFFIMSYIELQKERLNKNYKVTYEGFEEVKHVLISPFLLLPLVENCFKHVSNYPERENIIAIKCYKMNSVLCFDTYNTLIPGNHNKENGIGLENVKKRLQLIYPVKHELMTQTNADSFESKLRLTYE